MATFPVVETAYSRYLSQRALRVIGEPTEDQEQIDLDTARLHCRVDTYDDATTGHPEDVWLSGAIVAARQWCEAYSGRALAPQTLELRLDAFPTWRPIELPMPPCTGLTSFVIVDEDEVATEVTDYLLDTHSEPARLVPKSGASWPTATAAPGCIRIRYTAGYDEPGASPLLLPVPKLFRYAMLMVLAALYEYRENCTEETLREVPLGAQSLMNPKCVDMGMA